MQTPHVEAELIAATESVRPGESLLVALRLKHEPEWHTYWKNPGDSGMPTRIEWNLPEGFRAGPMSWPTPNSIPVGPLTNYGYDGEVFLLTQIATDRMLEPNRMVRLSAKAEWLVCREICLPGGANLTLNIPVANLAPNPSQYATKLNAAQTALPQNVANWDVSATHTDTHIVINVRPKSGSLPALASLQFFPDDAEVIDNPSPQRLEKNANGYTLKLIAAAAFKGDIKTLSGLLVSNSGWDAEGRRAVSFSTPYPGGAPKVTASGNAMSSPVRARDIAAAAPTSQFTLAIALGSALLGGLILNLMPCVFPIISIKVLGFAEEAHNDLARLRQYGLAFALGVLVCFWIIAGLLLALRASGHSLGWGYQLQSPVVITLLAVLFFVLALNLSGYFEFGTRLQSLAGRVSGGSGVRGAFVSGLIATLVATPCTAPFMGAALGYALTRPAWESMLVFTALAVGMSLPYLALSFYPRLLQRLPKPGRWMETLKQLLAFPLYLTVIWLIWVLSEQLGALAGAKLMVGLVLLAAAIWLRMRFFVLGKSQGFVRALAGLAAAVLIIAAIFAGWPRGEAIARTTSSTGSSAWKDYDQAALSAERTAGKTVFVDFTAAWCVTCQVNKRIVLESEPVKQAFAKLGVVRMRADWTNRDDKIAAAIASLGRSGVPVYAVYPANGGAPNLLPELLTKELVISALEAASQR